VRNKDGRDQEGYQYIAGLGTVATIKLKHDRPEKKFNYFLSRYVKNTPSRWLYI